MHWRLPSTEPGSFFYPIQLHLQAADFFVEFRLNGFVILVALGASRSKELSRSQLHLAFPLTNLGRMHLILSGQLIDCLQPLQGFQGHLGLQLGTVLDPFLPIGTPLQTTSESYYTRGLNFGVHYSFRSFM